MLSAKILENWILFFVYWSFGVEKWKLIQLIGFNLTSDNEVGIDQASVSSHVLHHHPRSS